MTRARAQTMKPKADQCHNNVLCLAIWETVCLHKDPKYYKSTRSNAAQVIIANISDCPTIQFSDRNGPSLGFLDTNAL